MLRCKRLVVPIDACNVGTAQFCPSRIVLDFPTSGHQFPARAFSTHPSMAIVEIKVSSANILWAKQCSRLRCDQLRHHNFSPIQTMASDLQ